MIPVCEPTLSKNSKKYVDECLETNWISSSGKFIAQFESAFASFCGVKYGISCNNGTSALHLALLALDIGKGDEVIVPSFTMIASVNAIIYTGATPVFIDARKDTWCLDETKIQEKITRKTKAILAVHIYGHPCNMDLLTEITIKHKLFLIEDAAEAHGAEYKGKRCGSFGHVAAFSFYGNKIITTGEGGMVLTNDENIAERVSQLKNHCFGKGADRFLHKHVGFNYRMTNIQAALGLAQMEQADELVAARRRNAHLYSSHLRDLPLLLPTEKEWAKNVYWMYGIVLGDDMKISRNDFMLQLFERGIETRPFFSPLHKQPCFFDQALANRPDCSGNYPVSDWLSERGLYLPSSSSLTEEQILKITTIIHELLRA